MSTNMSVHPNLGLQQRIRCGWPDRVAPGTHREKPQKILRSAGPRRDHACATTRFRQAMEGRGFQLAIIRVPDELAQIADATRLFVDRPERFSAIVCFNDLVALGIAAGLQDCGLAVGRDMSLVGFDDVSDAEAMRPRLTSVSTAPVTIGRNAATLLVERIAQPSLPPRRIVSPTYRTGP